MTETLFGASTFVWLLFVALGLVVVLIRRRARRSQPPQYPACPADTGAPGPVANGLRTARALFEHPVASGVVLMAAAAVALVWANLAPASYHAAWDARLSLGVAPFALSKPLLLWINDGLMAIFFLVVGLEIKREILGGELSSRRAVLPIVAAAGGMLAPAGIYGAINAGSRGATGWGIPMATDIAFALGALALLGSRVAPSLRVFLTAVAIADDLGAVIVIAIFYAGELHVIPLVIAGLLIAALGVVNRLGIQRTIPYTALGAALWVAVLESGVHATVAGVVLASTIPASRPGPRHGEASKRSLLARLEHGLQPWVAFGIMPVFALANAGVVVRGEIVSALIDPICIGIVLGLVLGKQLGVAGSCWVLVSLGLATLPSRSTWRELYGIALLCGIGFTMSLFIATLALVDEGDLRAAKIGILTGSLLSAIAGYLILRVGRPQGRVGIHQAR